MTAWGPWKRHQWKASSPYCDWDIYVSGLRGTLDDFVLLPTPGSQDSGPDLFPVPKVIANAGYSGAGDMAPPAARLPEITADTLVLGIIDIDIALGHRGFRQADGRTRVLASWQQGVSHAGANLPFGKALCEGELNTAIAAHSPGGIDRRLDADGFNRAVGLVDYLRPSGPGALATSAAHGTHVLGLAAGSDPHTFASDFPDVRLLVVNLPPMTAFGEGGAHLDHYLSYGLRWLVDTHRAIIAKSGLSNARPLTVNVSFGKQAGAKDESQAFVAELIHQIEAAGGGLNVLLPGGNDNMERCHARFEPKRTRGNWQATLDWRVQPDDGTANFVEIWSESVVAEGADPPALAISVSPPGHGGDAPQTPLPGQIAELKGGTGRIYCQQFDDQRRDTSGAEVRVVRTRYTVCLAPDTFAHGGAPAGLWRITLANPGAKDDEVRAMIQTDVAALPRVTNVRRSYFEDADYALYDSQGRPADTYLYSSTGAHDNLDGASHIRRHGTLNSYAANDKVVAVAGYRANDGRPAGYSATGLGEVRFEHDRGDPTAAFPSDDGWAHYGVLSYSPEGGAAVAMRGTSFACAQATRMVLKALGGKKTAKAIVTGRAVGALGAFPNVPSDKVGHGRVPKNEATWKVPRM